MRSNWAAVAALVILVSGAAAAAPRTQNIELPNDGDEYSALVTRAAAHDDSVDFRALRIAYLSSAAFKRAGAAFDKLRDLQSQMNAAMQSDDAKTVRDKAEQILSLDFTDLYAHKLLRQSCALLHDDVCAELHHFIEFGLLQSITRTGDGKTCATGWEAFQIKEEYFMLAMMDTTFTSQALVSDGGHSCDAMTVRDQSGATLTYYFNIDKMMEAEAGELGVKPGQ